jgi:RNA polymerase sigma-70 factor, ECF subfamily
LPCLTRSAAAKSGAVKVTPNKEEVQPAPVPGTLGAVLYAGSTRPASLEKDWVDLVRAIAAHDQSALHALYERAHRPVFTLIMRITCNRETADEVTLDVFHEVWRRASSYDPAGGSVLGWIMNQARSRAIDRLRFENRQKRTNPLGDDWRQPTAAQDSEDAIAFRQQREGLRDALALLTAEERQAIETAYFGEFTYEEAALRLNQPLGTVKTRIRSALSKLRHALAGGTTT